MDRRMLAVVLAVQVAVPLAATIHGVPSRFGFHMYSGRPGLTIVAEDGAGRQVPVDPDPLVAKMRVELDWTEELPRLVCRHLPQVRRVTVTSGDRSGTLTC